MVGVAIPQFLFGVFCIILFALNLQWFPVGQRGDGGLLSELHHLFLPAFVLGISQTAGVMRYSRSAMLDSMNCDYVKTARAKGLTEKVVIYSHAWRNALIPIVSLVIGWFLGIFGGSVVIENTFSLSGMGKLYWIGLNNNDFELVLAIQMFYSIVSLVGALLIVALFCMTILRGYWIALRAPDRFSTVLAAGLISLIAVQTILNLGVVTNLLPSTGIALPFFSYGGTALAVNLGEMGILLSISRYRNHPARQEAIQ